MRSSHSDRDWQGSERACTHEASPVVFEGGRAYLVCGRCGARERIFMSQEDFEREMGSEAADGPGV